MSGELNKWIGSEVLNRIISEIFALAVDDPEDDYQYGFNDAITKAANIVEKYEEATT